MEGHRGHRERKRAQREIHAAAAGSPAAVRHFSVVSVPLCALGVLDFVHSMGLRADARLRSKITRRRRFFGLWMAADSRRITAAKQPRFFDRIDRIDRIDGIDGFQQDCPLPGRKILSDESNSSERYCLRNVNSPTRNQSAKIRGHP